MLVLLVEHQCQEAKVVTMPEEEAVVQVVLLVVMVLIQAETLAVEAVKALLFLLRSGVQLIHMEEQDALVNHQLPADSTLLAEEEEQVAPLHRLT
tara:strand:+ start:48 stop:332 length:285 start_codon:yes stop_codon:yes gene_type:complete